MPLPSQLLLAMLDRTHIAAAASAADDDSDGGGIVSSGRWQLYKKFYVLLPGCGCAGRPAGLGEMKMGFSTNSYVDDPTQQ